MVNRAVFSSWPYNHAVMGLHNLVPMVSGDLLTRYYRKRGDKVVFISGCDEYGDRMETRARLDNISPQMLADKNYERTSELLKRFDIGLTVFYRTTAEDHRTAVQNCLMELYRQKLIALSRFEYYYCPNCKKYLSDVFVLGECARCGRFDSLNHHYSACDVLGPVELVHPICGVCKHHGRTVRIVRKSSKEWAFKMDMRDIRTHRGNWSKVAQEGTTEALMGGADSISISRDNSWGVPLPFHSSQTVFGWVDSLLGNLTVCHMIKSKNEETLRDVVTTYCIGKDNVPFYSILYPSLLGALRAGWLSPHNLVANHYICFHNTPCSKSRSTTIDLETAINLLPADYWRAYLISIFPIESNRNFDPAQFDQFVREELLAFDRYVHSIYELASKLHRQGENHVGQCDGRLVRDLNHFLGEIQHHMGNYDFPKALQAIIQKARDSSRALSGALAGRNIDMDSLGGHLRNLFVMSYVIEIFLPGTHRRIDSLFGFDPTETDWGKVHATRLRWTIDVSGYEPLFTTLSYEDVLIRIIQLVNAGEFVGETENLPATPIPIKWDACDCESWFQVCPTKPRG